VRYPRPGSRTLTTPPRPTKGQDGYSLRRHSPERNAAKVHAPPAPCSWHDSTTLQFLVKQHGLAAIPVRGLPKAKTRFAARTRSETWALCCVRRRRNRVAPCLNLCFSLREASSYMECRRGAYFKQRNPPASVWSPTGSLPSIQRSLPVQESSELSAGRPDSSHVSRTVDLVAWACRQLSPGTTMITVRWVPDEPASRDRIAPNGDSLLKATRSPSPGFELSDSPAAIQHEPPSNHSCTRADTHGSMTTRRCVS